MRHDVEHEEDEAREWLEAALPSRYIAGELGIQSTEAALNRYRDAVEARVRAGVSADLESLPTYNDVADWCAHVGRRQAVDVARNGRRK